MLCNGDVALQFCAVAIQAQTDRTYITLTYSNFLGVMKVHIKLYISDKNPFCSGEVVRKLFARHCRAIAPYRQNCRPLF